MKQQTALFTCSLGDGEFDHVSLGIADGPHPTEMGDAVDHFAQKYPNRYWRLYVGEPTAEDEPLYSHDPSKNPLAEAEAFREELATVF